jgi:hypothetical protein
MAAVKATAQTSAAAKKFWTRVAFMVAVLQKRPHPDWYTPRKRWRCGRVRPGD